MRLLIGLLLLVCWLLYRSDSPESSASDSRMKSNLDVSTIKSSKKLVLKYPSSDFTTAQKVTSALWAWGLFLNRRDALVQSLYFSREMRILEPVAPFVLGADEAGMEFLQALTPSHLHWLKSLSPEQMAGLELGKEVCLRRGLSAEMCLFLSKAEAVPILGVRSTSPLNLPLKGAQCELSPQASSLSLSCNTSVQLPELPLPQTPRSFVRLQLQKPDWLEMEAVESLARHRVSSDWIQFLPQIQTLNLEVSLESLQGPQFDLWINFARPGDSARFAHKAKELFPAQTVTLVRTLSEVRLFTRKLLPEKVNARGSLSINWNLVAFESVILKLIQDAGQNFSNHSRQQCNQAQSGKQHCFLGVRFDEQGRCPMHEGSQHVQLTSRLFSDLEGLLPDLLVGVVEVISGNEALAISLRWR